MVPQLISPAGQIGRDRKSAYINRINPPPFPPVSPGGFFFRRSVCRGADVPSRRGCRTTNGRPYVHRRNRDQIRRGGHCCPPLSISPAPCRGRCPHAVRRRLLHSVSAGAAKTPYPQPPSSSPKGNRFTGLPFGFISLPQRLASPYEGEVAFAKQMPERSTDARDRPFLALRRTNRPHSRSSRIG